jgi:hypothetical protein
MAIKHIIVLFVETPRKFITAKLSIRKSRASGTRVRKYFPKKEKQDNYNNLDKRKNYEKF